MDAPILFILLAILFLDNSHLSLGGYYFGIYYYLFFIFFLVRISYDQIFFQSHLTVLFPQILIIIVIFYLQPYFLQCLHTIIHRYHRRCYQYQYNIGKYTLTLCFQHFNFIYQRRDYYHRCRRP